MVRSFSRRIGRGKIAVSPCAAPLVPEVCSGSTEGCLGAGETHFPRPKGRLLDRVARQLRVPEDQPGGGVQSREARADENAEGLVVALGCPLDETRLVHAAP